MILILKAVHLFAAFAWMAGCWYYPRLLIYQRETFDQEGTDNPKITLLSTMAQRLMRVILMPAMTITWVVGLAMIATGGFTPGGWLHAKLTLLVLLTAFTGYIVRVGKQMRGGDYRHSTRTLRLLNEAPTLILIGILFFVVVYRTL